MENLNITIPKDFEEYYEYYSYDEEDCKENIKNDKNSIETVLTDLERIKIYVTEYTSEYEEYDFIKIKKMIKKIQDLIRNSSFSKTITVENNYVKIDIIEEKTLHDFTTDEYDLKIIINHSIAFRTDMRRIYHIEEKSIVKESTNDPDYVTIDPIYNDDYVSFDHFYVTKKRLLVHDLKSFGKIPKEQAYEVINKFEQAEFEKQKKLTRCVT